MANWIPNDTILTGKTVKLIPLQEAHFEELKELAKEKKIWEFVPRDMSTDEKVVKALAGGIAEREMGTQFPFVIYHQADKKLIGSTRLMNAEPDHKKLEIGWTWLHPDYWATAVNLECKLLLLTFCFEDLKAFRVQLRTDENNIRSRKAIEKIGAKFEGILRNDMIRENGTKRNSAYFSITDEEWPEAKNRLTHLYQNIATKMHG